MGANFAQTALPMVKGGLTGLGQGLSQYGNQNPTFDFSKIQRPALGQGITPNARKQQALTQTQQMSPFAANPFSGNYT